MSLLMQGVSYYLFAQSFQREYPNISDAVDKATGAIKAENDAGRLQSKESFNWIPSTSIQDAVVPTHGNFAGPGYSGGDRTPKTREEILAAPVAPVTDPVTGVDRPDEVDKIAKIHDLAYTDAETHTCLSEYKAAIYAADQELIDATRAMLANDKYGTIHLTANNRGQTTVFQPYYSSTALPLSSIPCTAKTFLARSIPTQIMLMDFPFRWLQMDDYPISILALSCRAFTAPPGLGSPFYSLGVAVA